MDESNPPYFYDVETDFSWDTNGKFLQDSPFQHDIIATCSNDLIFACFDGSVPASIDAFVSDVEYECNGHFNGDLTAEEALDNVRKALTAMKAIKP